MSQTLRLMLLLLRAYVRDRTALFFSFFLPFLFMVIFGTLNFGAAAKANLGIADLARNADSAQFVSTLGKIDTFTIHDLDREDALRKIRRSELDMVLVLPAAFRIAPARPGAPVPVLELYENTASQASVAVGGAILRDVIDRMSFAVSGTGPVVSISRQEVAGVRLRYVDFLVPGVLGMNVMQLNVFSIAFALVGWKQTGALRRILATPIDPRRFVAAHGLMRLLMSTAQVGILVAVAFLMFQVRLVGGLVELLLFALIGALPFLMLGFVLAGWGKTEDQVQPVAQLITLPQLFVSGVFFSKDAAPELIRPITNFLPLTFVIDGMREIAVQGASLWDVRTAILGLLVWTVVGFVAAVRLLRFET
ncbi:MAG: ABC transporter permease [Candidatus Rokubacteria bacterium]|nr:ABC transporter permease [Candidatus Rokubacteria bacterium]